MRSNFSNYLTENPYIGIPFTLIIGAVTMAICMTIILVPVHFFGGNGTDEKKPTTQQPTEEI